MSDKIAISQDEMNKLISRRQELLDQIHRLAEETSENLEGKPGETTFSHGANQLAILSHRLSVIINQIDECTVDPNLDQDSCIRVRVGHRVTVQDKDGESITFRIIANGANPWGDEDIASAKSPIGKALLDHCIGETVIAQWEILDGVASITYTIIDITI